MIKFFKHIRQRLLSENPPDQSIRAGKVGKYMTYAFGEIILVVIGILIALSINNWNEFRKERIIENELIDELHITVKDNHESLLGGLERWQSTTEALDLIIFIIDQQIPYSDTLEIYFREAHKKRGNNLNSLNFSGYKSLENKGYNIIRNRNLREELINLFDDWLSGLAATNEQLDVGASSFHYEYIAKNFRLDKDGHIPHDSEAVLNDPYYHSILQSLRNIMQRKINRVNNYLRKSEKILELLEDELDQKK